MRAPAEGILARAERYAALMEAEGLATRAALARRLGVSRAAVTQTLRVLDAPEEVLDAMREAARRGAPVMDRQWRAWRGLSGEEVRRRIRVLG